MDLSIVVKDLSMVASNESICSGSVWPNSCDELVSKAGAREGLEGAIAPLSEHASPLSELQNYFVGEFCYLQYPGSRILSPLSEESAHPVGEFLAPLLLVSS